MITVMRFNFAVPGLDRGALSRSYRAGVEMARYADGRGLDMVSLEEHHTADDGWSPAPLINAGFVLGATSKVRVVVQALLAPLHEPLRLAEETAVLDLASGGRLTVVAGLGYRPEEYAAFGRDWTARGRAVDHILDTLVAAWSGEPFTYRELGEPADAPGRTVRLTPPPASAPAQLIWVGGGAKVSARRAARLGLPFCPPKNDPELGAYYSQQCAEYGTSGFAIMPPDPTVLTFLAEDPDRVWAEHGHHFLHEATVYDAWQQPGQTSAVRSHATTAQELRAEGVYEVITPKECVERSRAAGPLAVNVLHPLVGGMPPEAAWESVHLYFDQVLPEIARA